MASIPRSMIEPGRQIAYVKPMTFASHSQTQTQSRLYMDHNATAPVLEVAREAALAAMTLIGNPSSVHGPGRDARAAMEQARAQVAALAHARPRDIVFTSGGTEANNAVIRSSGARTIIISAVEHDCVLAAARAAEAAGATLYICPTDTDGIVDLDQLDDLLSRAEGSTLISVMAANNETGAVQPLSDIAARAKAAGARFHSDTVQAAGRIDLDIGAIGADYLTLSAHKIGGLKGVGAVVLCGDAPLNAFIAGGGQELGRRSGTENIPGIAAFGAAAASAMVTASDAAQSAIRARRDQLEAGIRCRANDAHILAANTARLANTSCIRMPGVRGETQVMHFDLNGIAISSGSACSSGKVKSSHVLRAMGLDDVAAGESVRISIGADTTDADIDRAVTVWTDLYDRRKR